MQGRQLWIVAGLVVLGAVLITGTTVAVAYIGGVAIGTVRARRVDGVLMTEEQANLWGRMKAAAADDGVTLVVDSAFRTNEEQQSLYEKWKAGLTPFQAALPGHSIHQSGKAFDIAVQRSTSSPAYRWLAANGDRFGIQNTGATFSPPEYHHWEIT